MLPNLLLRASDSEKSNPGLALQEYMSGTGGGRGVKFEEEEEGEVGTVVLELTEKLLEFFNDFWVIHVFIVVETGEEELMEVFINVTKDEVVEGEDKVVEVWTFVDKFEGDLPEVGHTLLAVEIGEIVLPEEIVGETIVVVVEQYMGE